MDKFEAFQLVRDFAQKHLSFGVNEEIQEKFAEVLQAYVESLSPEERNLGSVIMVDGKRVFIRRSDYPKIVKKDPKIAERLLQAFSR